MQDNLNKIIFSSKIKQDQKEKLRFKKRCFLSLIALTVLGTICGFCFTRSSKQPPTYSNRYFELTVVDAFGSNVAGADVYLNSKYQGVTDAFGQLRKSFMIYSNESLNIEVKKNKTSSNSKLDVASFKNDIQTSIKL